MNAIPPTDDGLAPSPGWAGRSKGGDARGLVVGRMLFVSGYAAILLWFRGVDVYHRHFLDAGPLVLANNLCRVLFIVYLFWMVHAAGAFVVRLAAGTAAVGSMLEGVALRFFAGTGVWHVVLLILGFLDLYTWPVMAAITLPVVALSYPHAAEAAKEARRWVAEYVSGAGRRDIAIAALLIALFLAVLMIKGLYPSGGHDYFTHYFLYDRAVIERGGLAPNEVWYHYYYSKGVGLYFLAMLLTDPLAPQLVTFTFYAASLIVLFLLLRRFAPDSRWVWASLILFLGLFIYTPGPGDTRSHGGWGDFEKFHELNAALTIGIIWISIRMLEMRGRQMLAAMVAAGSAIVAAVIINTTSAAYFVTVFGLLSLWYIWNRMPDRALQCACLATVAGVVAAAMLLVNQLTTGLMSDQILGLAWKFADVEKLHNWGALPPLLTTLWGRVGMAAESASLVGTVKLLVKTLRLELFGPLLAWGAVTAAAALRHRRGSISAREQVLVVIGALATTIGFALTTGIAQPISFYRYSSFALPIVLLCGVLLIRIGYDAEGTIGRLARNSRTPLAIVLACFVTTFISYHPRRAPADAVIDATRFAVGWYSIDKAYTTQEGWPARRSWGGIYQGARGAYAVVGPHIRIWSMHTESYCMLPDCRIETWPAFVMTRDWDRLMFGSPEEGRAALQGAGVDYFLFSTELYLYDPLPLSPLFAPDHIGQYLGVRWSDGKTSLLTWSGPDTRPLDTEWIAQYRRAIESSAVVQSFPYATMREIYARLRATPHPWRSFTLPWSAGSH